MDDRNSSLILYLARPSVGNDVSRLIRGLAGLDGIRRIEPISKPRMLIVEYERGLIALAAPCARAPRLVGGAFSRNGNVPSRGEFRVSSVIANRHPVPTVA